jgi:hypothetical protein
VGWPTRKISAIWTGFVTASVFSYSAARSIFRALSQRTRVGDSRRVRTGDAQSFSTYGKNLASMVQTV